MLSILFYRKVILLFLLPGYSHNTVNRVVAWCCNTMVGKTFYTLKEVVECVNGINYVRASFIDHHSEKHPLYIGWDVNLKK